jgi:hypothetical protein
MHIDIGSHLGGHMMFKFFIVVSMMSFAVPVTAAVTMPADAYVLVSSDRIGMFDQVKNDYLKNAQLSGMYPQKFTVDANVKTPAGNPCRGLSLKEVETTLLYRDGEGVMHSVQHTVCDGQGQKANYIVGVVPGSDHVVAEQGFKKRVWVYKMNERGINDDVCGTSKTQVQTVCAPDGYSVYNAFIDDANTEKSSGSNSLKIEPDLSKKNCVLVTFLMAGKGFKSPAILGCEEGSWYRYAIDLAGVTTAVPNNLP